MDFRRWQATARVALLCCILVAAPALASDVVDHTLTYPKVLQLAARGGVARQLSQQMVLWYGTVETIKAATPFQDMHVRLSGGHRVTVRYKASTRNLDVDRTGYRVAMKGYPQFNPDGSFSHLLGRSCILLSPAPSLGFRRFQSLIKNPTHSPAELIAWRMHFHNPHYKVEDVLLYGTTIVQEARKNGLDPYMLAALLQIESAYDIDAVSSSGAVGLGQLMSFTAAGLGVDATDPVQNIKGSARYLGGLVQRFSAWPNPATYAMAGYNAGPNAVERAGGIPPYAETRNYVHFVGLVWKELQAEARSFKITQ